MKFDRALCHQLNCVLTIYQARELHFDEESIFDSKSMAYECPDEDCSAEMIGVNDTSVRFKTTPHFRTKQGAVHSESCDYSKNSSSPKSTELSKPGTSHGYKVTDIPEEFLLERQAPPVGQGKKQKKQDTMNEEGTEHLTATQGDKFSVHKTSCLEHIVEVWETHTPESLKDIALTIGHKTKYYRNIFKPIRFFTDEEGLIYFGEVENIESFGQDYAIRFKDRPGYPDPKSDKYKISIYLRSDLINTYRKRKLFREHIDMLKILTAEKVTCYFVGAYPKLIDKTGKFGPFKALELNITNLDHLVLRYYSGGEE